MLPGMYNSSIQVELNYREPACESSEELGQKQGTVLMLPTLKDRITLQAGKILISLGQKMTATSERHMQLSKEMV